MPKGIGGTPRPDPTTPPDFSQYITYFIHSFFVQGDDTEQLKIKFIIVLWPCSTLTIIALGIFQKSHDVVVTSWR